MHDRGLIQTGMPGAASNARGEYSSRPARAASEQTSKRPVTIPVTFLPGDIFEKGPGFLTARACREHLLREWRARPPRDRTGIVNIAVRAARQRDQGCRCGVRPSRGKRRSCGRGAMTLDDEIRLVRREMNARNVSSGEPRRLAGVGRRLFLCARRAMAGRHAAA